MYTPSLYSKTLQNNYKVNKQYKTSLPLNNIFMVRKFVFFYIDVFMKDIVKRELVFGFFYISFICLSDPTNNQKQVPYT